MKLLIVILVFLAISLVLKIMELGFKRLSGLSPRWNIRNGYLTSIAFIIWVIFVFWSLDYLFKEKFFYQYLIITLIIILVLFISWYFLNDMMAGVIFKIKHDLKVGANLHAGKYSGKIKSIHITYVSLREESGKIVRVPYSRINQEIVSEGSLSLPREEQMLRILVSASTSKSEAVDLIRAIIMTNPWSPVKEEPAVRFREETDTGSVFEVVISTMRLKQIQFIENEIKNNPYMMIL